MNIKQMRTIVENKGLTVILDCNGYKVQKDGVTILCFDRKYVKYNMNYGDLAAHLERVGA